MVRPVILAFPGFRPHALFHQVAYRITQFFATIRWLFEFLCVISPRRCPLTELPTEVIEEILKHVEWQSLLRVRASCTRLNMVSRSLSVWRGQYARYMTANPNAAPLEASIDSYSPSELEEVILKRSAVAPGWLAPHCPASMSTIPYAGRFLHLVEGGRWLLSSDHGSVIAYDLDNTTAPGQPIIPEMPGRQRTIELSVDVLRDASTFTFNIAIEQSTYKDDIPSWTHLWQVTMHGRGTTAELRAMHLKSFTTTGLFWSVAACLKDQYYARSVVISSLSRDCIYEIYIWGEANLHGHRKAVMRSFSNGRVIRVLPSDRFLVFECAEIMIYDFPPFETVPVGDQTRGLHATPLYSVQLPGSRLASFTVSSVVIQPLDTYSLVACTDAGILAVTLSPTASYIRVLFTLPDEPALEIDTQITDVQMGWRRAYIQYYKYALAISYDTRHHIVESTTVPADACAFRRVMIPNDEYPSMMDESSGRVVIQKSESLLTVYYYSLYDVNK